MTDRSAAASIAPAPAGSDSAGRDWFLRDSRWHDEVWVFTPTNAWSTSAPCRSAGVLFVQRTMFYRRFLRSATRGCEDAAGADPCP